MRKAETCSDRISHARPLSMKRGLEVVGWAVASAAWWVTTAGAVGRPLEWAYAAAESRAGVEVPSPANDRSWAAPGANPFEVVDWAPATHPPMPPIVAHGRKPGVAACGHCHLANGFGRPDNANLAGLPAEYIVRQMTDYKSSLRRSADPRRPSSAMAAVARLVDAGDIDEAARYFAAVRPRPWVRVEEIDRLPGGQTRDAIGTRVVEVPDPGIPNQPPSGFVAYVPRGSVSRGEALVQTGGGGRTVRCALCHGDDLRGTSSVPGLAGRSPTYLARQLNDMHQGSRFGSRPDRMMGTVARLAEPDVVAIVAYLASLAP
jgi:cytochrome c553